MLFLTSSSKKTRLFYYVLASSSLRDSISCFDKKWRQPSALRPDFTSAKYSGNSSAIGISFLFFPGVGEFANET